MDKNKIKLLEKAALTLHRRIKAGAYGAEKSDLIKMKKRVKKALKILKNGEK